MSASIECTRLIPYDLFIIVCPKICYIPDVREVAHESSVRLAYSPATQTYIVEFVGFTRFVDVSHQHVGDKTIAYGYQ